MTLYEHYVHYIPLPELITRPITRLLVTNFCSHVDALVAPSQSAKKAIKAQGITKSVHVVPLSILPIFESGCRLHKKFDHKKSVQLLSVSRFTKEKNIFFLLDMFAQINNKACKLTLIGFGPCLEELKEYAYKKLALSPANVSFIIKPTKQEIKQWYAKADFFVYASQTETQGIVLAEAMSQGTPVVALSGPGIVDIVRDGMNGFLVTSAQEMVKKIEQTIQDPRFYNDLCLGACKTAKNYTSKACVKKLLAVYYCLLEREHRSSIG